MKASGAPNNNSLQVKPVCIIGNLNIDLIIRNVPRLPTWGTEVFGESHVIVSSGQAGYIGLALTHLGIPTSIIGNVGQDVNGQQILNDLKASGADISACEKTASDQTGITVAIVRMDGERAFVSNFASLRDFDEALALRHWDKIHQAGIVGMVGTFALPNLKLNAIARLMAKAYQSGKVTMLDTGWDPSNWQDDTILGIKEVLHYVTLFMPNLDEARAITKAETVQEAGDILATLGPAVVVIKCGAEGSYAKIGGQTYFLPAQSVDVYNAVGAGDTFGAGFIYGYRRGCPIEACLAFGNSAAALYVSKDNDRYPDINDVMNIAKLYKAFSSNLIKGEV